MREVQVLMKVSSRHICGFAHPLLSRLDVALSIAPLSSFEIFLPSSPQPPFPLIFASSPRSLSPSITLIIGLDAQLFSPLPVPSAPLSLSHLTSLLSSVLDHGLQQGRMFQVVEKLQGRSLSEALTQVVAPTRSDYEGCQSARAILYDSCARNRGVLQIADYAPSPAD